MASREDIDEFNKYYFKESYNICCLVIDKVKIDLVKQNKLAQNPKDHFGANPFGK